MRTIFFTGLVVAAVLLTSPAEAWHRRHPRVSPYRHALRDRPAPPSVYGSAGGWQGEAIARATARMQAAPGTTNELAPDAKETATGGPVGGVPGFSGR